LLGDNMSLLGGLGGLTGLLPVSSARTLPAVSGMPAGGTPVAPSDVPPGTTTPAADDTTPPADTPPADATAPAKKPAADPATASDSRLHEEPIDPEGRSGATDTRKFSDGRPVAGVDSQFK
jgi:hypothetical protein